MEETVERKDIVNEKRVEKEKKDELQATEESTAKETGEKSENSDKKREREECSCFECEMKQIKEPVAPCDNENCECCKTKKRLVSLVERQDSMIKGLFVRLMLSRLTK
jgi:hypothetical protein